MRNIGAIFVRYLCSMPELPEVETIRLGLVSKVLNKKIKRVWIESSFKNKISPNAGKFIKLLKDEKIKDIERKGKLLIFKITSDDFILVHLIMTGQLVYQSSKGSLVAGGHPIQNQEVLPNKFTRVQFDFIDGSRLYFNDVRKFGYLKLVDKLEMEQAKARYGVEPIDKDYTFEYFNKVLSKRPNQMIKVLLLEQKDISGLGNIYVDETCFAAGVKPQRRIKTLSKVERKKIFINTTKILQKAIKYQGTSFSNYLNSEGQLGGFQKFLKVYGRVGKPCLMCENSELRRIKIAGRTSSYCPECQK